MKPNPTRYKKPDEAGYILLGAIILLALFVIALAVAAPDVAKSIQHDREIETMHRGKQYIRALQLYYRRFHAYPPNIEALVKTNDIRFLRKKYTDPMTGKDDWKPVLFGQNKTPMAMGFFGQPLGGTGGNVMAGTGPGGSGGTGLGGSTFGGSSFGGGSTMGGGSTFGSGSIFGSPTSSGDTGSPTGSPTGTTSGTGTSGTDSSGSSSGSSMNSGMTFGGAGVIGVSPGSTRQSILVYKEKNHFNEWEFLYSPLSDQPVMSSTGAGSLGTSATGFGGSTNTLGGNGITGPTGTGGGSPGIGGSSTTTSPQ